MCANKRKEIKNVQKLYTTHSIFLIHLIFFIQNNIYLEKNYIITNYWIEYEINKNNNFLSNSLHFKNLLIQIHIYLKYYYWKITVLENKIHNNICDLPFWHTRILVMHILNLDPYLIYRPYISMIKLKVERSLDRSAYV